MFWVGIGASAGGLEALRGLVRNLRADVNATYIVAQHMAPHHRSLLSEIIGRETSMAVLDVTDRLVPERNKFYITPPNQNIILEDGMLRLVEPSKEPGAPKPSVDVFFNSLAQGIGEHAVGIVLSGTGSDGAKGIRAIRKHGGITIAQDDLTARYSGMPVSAIETGVIDLVMSPEEIGAQISKIIMMPRNLDKLRASPLSRNGTSEIIQLLMDQTKVNFRHYKTATFQRRVERRMAACEVDNLDDYVAIARKSEKEVGELFKDLLISVTSFFRDAPEFDAIKEHIATIVESNTTGQIRVWVPGTATGEEAYSIAFLFCEAMERYGVASKTKLQIFATDIDMNAIEVARKGFYSQSAVDQIPEKLIEKYFDKAVAGFTVKKVIREKMVFSYHNIAQDPPFLKMDMISCRNLLIYFQSNLQAEVFNRFHYALLPSGLLFLGRSEAVAASEALFAQAGLNKHIFFQRPSHQRRAPRQMTYDKPLPFRPMKTVDAQQAQDEIKAASDTLEGLIGKLGKCAIWIDSDMNMVKTYGALDEYTGVPAGVISTRATVLLRDPYKQDVQAIVPAVIRSGQMTRGFNRAKKSDPTQRERMTVYPLHDFKTGDDTALVVFEEWEDATVINVRTTQGENPNIDALEAQVRSLSDELQIAKANLQITVEELETSNEELQAFTEELQSSNEELQSTNEELETSNEELQSTNEELSTVNEELHVNTGQLTSANQNMSSILDNLMLPLLVVDRNLAITNVSAVAEDFFGIEQDLTFPHVGRCKQRPGFPNLVEALENTMMSGEPQQWQINEDDYSAIMKIVPHFSHSNELVGAIVVVNDSTKELRKAHFELQLIFEHVPDAIMVLDSDGKVLQANAATSNLLDEPETDLVGTRFFDHFDADTAAQFQAEDQAVLETGKPSYGQNVLATFKDGKQIWANRSLIPASHPQSDGAVVYSVTRDVTAQQTAAVALEESELRLDQAVNASGVCLWAYDLEDQTAFWSDRLIDLLGLTQDEFDQNLGTIEGINTYVHPDDLNGVNAAMQAHLDRDGVPYTPIYRLGTKKNGYIWVESRGSVIRDDHGKAIRFTGTLKDVTDKKRAEETMREKTEQLELAASMSGIGHWTIDVAAKTVFWSDQVHVIHKTDKNTYVPTLETGIDFYHPEDRTKVARHVEVSLAKGEGFDFDARIVRSDGEIRIVRSIGSPNLGETGDVISVFGVFQDITDPKTRELNLKDTMAELARSNEELNRFSYVCSHDMKEPVRMIESMAELLINPKFQADAEKRDDLLRRISVNTKRMRGIIDSLLAYSRIDAKVDAEDVDLNRILGELIDSLTLIIEEANATIEIGDMPTVFGAPVHFTQLFHNLISNAIKFSDKKKPVVRVSSKEVSGGWELLIEDNGPGIPTESRKEIFNIFSRLQRRDEVEGTGLGLSIAQRIVLQYGGQLECRDTKLGGIAFEIYLPNQPAEAE
ncbi:MAG: chemotaxis protein CheB [Yoonia sp.]|uniref:chemotaxis protein CheB n=1 Tax=Yoonia sp. TaxID=2212373 RepID=UPI003EF16624